MSSKKHLYQGDDLKKLELMFREIAKSVPFNKRFSNYDVEKELIAINSLCKIVIAMYKLNDFRASSYAYIFTLPKIDEIIQYCYKFIKNDNIFEWCNKKSDFARVRQQDGSMKQYSNLGYIYEYLKDQQMAISARWFIEHNIQYLEKDKSEKDYPQRSKILESAIWWINQGLLGRFNLSMPFSQKKYDFIPEVVIFATFPSSGKSYVVNTCNEMFSELNMIINEMGGFLRVGNEQGNIFRQSRQTMALIENKLIFDIYPENKKFIFNGKYNPFNKSSEEEWGMNGVKFDPSTNIFKTRDSAINSVRCKIASMDDPSRGQQECTNMKIHNDIVQLYRGDFLDRFKNQSDKFIILCGTMFNPYDVISLESQQALKNATKDERFANTYISEDKKTVVIINDCENEYGGSAFPEFISDDALRKKRDGLDPYDYACVWRQKPIPAEGLIFDYDMLKVWADLPYSDLSEYSKAYIDPTRRSAKDFFAMPICRQNKTSQDHYLVDAICEQKSSKDLYDNIVQKIIDYKIIKLVVEENVDASLISVINSKLKEKNIKWCEIVPKYNTVNKSQRIADMAGSVKRNMVFPNKYAVNPKSQLGIFVRMLTQYTTTGGNVHDDPPDAICGYAEHFIVNENAKNEIRFGKKFPY